MRDLLPEEAAMRRTLARRVLDRFALHGFAIVTPPVFEFADVLERGLGTLDPADVLRFVEPESGEVAALRPDMTPQIARMIATRLRGRPPPLRLSYEGTVLRRRTGRARKHRQIPQAGVELAGVAGPEGDLELIALLVDTLRATGLERFTIDLGDAGVVRALLADLPSERHAALSEAISRKDDAEIAQACEATGAAQADALQALPWLHGGRDALVDGIGRLAKTPAAGPARRLLALFDAAAARGFGEHLTADLGEVRGFAYYTGTVVHAYAAGTGDAVASGGRYDELLGSIRLGPARGRVRHRPRPRCRGALRGGRGVPLAGARRGGGAGRRPAPGRATRSRSRRRRPGRSQGGPCLGASLGFHTCARLVRLGGRRQRR